MLVMGYAPQWTEHLRYALMARTGLANTSVTSVGDEADRVMAADVRPITSRLTDPAMKTGPGGPHTQCLPEGLPVSSRFLARPQLLTR